MGFRSLFTKGVAVTSAGRTSQHSRKASSYAKQAMNCFRQAKSLKADKKIDKMLDGLSLSNKLIKFMPANIFIKIKEEYGQNFQ